MASPGWGGPGAGGQAGSPGPGARRGGPGGPGAFRHNPALAAALLAATAAAVGASSALVGGGLVVGMLVVYILDMTGVKEGAVGALWITLGLGNVGVLMQSIAFGSLKLGWLLLLLTAFVSSQLFFLLGLWGTVQFRWVQLQYPAGMVICERVLLGATPVVAAMIIGWGVTEALGVRQAPFYLVAAQCVLHWFFGRPLPSSFAAAASGRSRGGSRAPPESLACGRLEGALQTVALVTMAPLFYAAAHRGRLFEWEHVWSMLLLTSLPVLYLAVADSGEGLWWTGLAPGVLDALRLVGAAVALAAALAGLEGRVLFAAFTQYIHLPAPWSYVAVTVALYSVGAVAVALFMSRMRDDLVMDSNVLSVLLVLGATGAALALGVPLLIMPAPMVMASGLALFIDSWAMRDYLLLVVGAVLTAVWFVSHHFWYLDVVIGGLHLKHICSAIVAAGVASVTVPGMALSDTPRALVGLVAVVPSALLCFLEEHLYASSLEDPDSFYPPYLILATSGLGVATAAMLEGADRVSVKVAWALKCLFLSKLSMLLIPEARLFFPALALTLAVTPSMLLYRGKAGRPLKMNKAQGYGHGLLICAAAAYARFAVFDVLRVVTGRRPAEGLLVGALAIVAGLGCVPVAFLHFAYSALAKKVVVTLCALGLVLALLEPPFPIRGGAECPRLPFRLCPRLWDEGHVPEHLQDDVNIYGELGRAHWPKWLLVAGVGAGIAGLSSRPAKEGVLARVAAALVAGACVGAYVSLELFPDQFVMQVLVAAATLMTSVFLVFLYSPSVSSPTFVPLVFGALVAFLPVSLLVQAQLPPPAPQGTADRIFADIQHDLAREAQTALLVCYAADLLLIAFTIKVKVAIPAKAAVPARAAGLAAIRRPAHMLQHVAPGLLARSTASGHPQWVPAAGNVATVACFLVALALSLRLADSPDTPILALAPILLLLNRDPVFLKTFSDRQRYAPVQVAVAAHLAFSAVVQIVGHLLPIPQSITAIDPTPVAVVRNLLTLGLVLPAHVLFAKFLWMRRDPDEGWLLLLAPLNVPALALTDVNTVRVLGVLGIAFSATQFFAGRFIKVAGARIL